MLRTFSNLQLYVMQHVLQNLLLMEKILLGRNNYTGCLWDTPEFVVLLVKEYWYSFPWDLRGSTKTESPWYLQGSRIVGRPLFENRVFHEGHAPL